MQGIKQNKRRSLYDDLKMAIMQIKHMNIAYLAEAVAKGVNGDKQALTEIYNLTYRMVYFTALKITQNDNDAQDLVQETYIKAFQSLGTLQDGTAFIKWLKTITANLCKNYMKKSRPLLFESEKQQESELGIIPETNEDFLPEQYVDSREKAQLVMGIVDKLPALQRTAVILYYFDELSVAEIAAVMDTSEGTIKSRLNYARSKIKSEVEELESKGTRLYGTAALPVLSRILQDVARECNLPGDSANTILSEVLKSGEKPIESVPSASADSTADLAIHSVVPAKEAVLSLSSVIAKFVAAPLLTKIAVGLVTLSLVAGGVAIGRTGIRNSSVSMPITLNASSQESAEQTSEATAATAATAETAETDPESTKEITGDDEIGIYKNHFLKNFRLKNAQAFFADLTHDGQKEMVVNYGDGMSGDLVVITIDKNKQARQIYSAYCDTTTNQQYGYRLYTENSKAYLMVHAAFQRQGNPQEFYRIFSLDETGREIPYIEKNIEYVVSETGDLEGTTQAELDQLNLELKEYKSKSEVLLDSSTGDMAYPKGENFTAGPDHENLTALDGLILKDDTALLAFLGKTDTSKGWERVYEGLSITSNYGAWDSFYIKSPRYSVCGIYVGQAKDEAVRQLGRYTLSRERNNKTLYILTDKPAATEGSFIVLPEYENGVVKSIYYQVVFLQAVDGKGE